MARSPLPWRVSEDGSDGFYAHDERMYDILDRDGNYVAHGGPIEDGGPDVGVFTLDDAEFIVKVANAY